MLIKVAIDKIIPRIERRLKTDSIDFKYLFKPIKVCFAKDLKRYIIIDGHHRYYLLRDLGVKKIYCICNKTQSKTIFKGNKPILKMDGKFGK